MGVSWRQCPVRAGSPSLPRPWRSPCRFHRIPPAKQLQSSGRAEGQRARTPTLDGGELLSRWKVCTWDGACVGVAVFGKHHLTPYMISGSSKSTEGLRTVISILEMDKLRLREAQGLALGSLVSNLSELQSPTP